MFNPHNSKEIVFPHVIPTTILDGKQYSFNNVNGAIKPIGYFGLTTNTFLGGQCKIMGFINELGFWGCQDKHEIGKLRAFYLHDPSTVTEYGKQMIQKAFPTNTIQYISYDDIPVTKRDVKRQEKAEKEAQQHGISPKLIDKKAVETLETLIDTVVYEENHEKQQERSSPTANELLKKSVRRRNKQPATVNA
jgi:hypothetical protein